MKKLILSLILAAAAIAQNPVVRELGCTAASASGTAYTCAIAVAPAGYVTATKYWFVSDVANTGAATINFNALGAKTIKKVAGGVTTDLIANDIRAGQHVALAYDGTNMQMLSQPGNSASYTLPAPTATTLGGVKSADCTGTGHVAIIATDGSVTCSADAGGSVGIPLPLSKRWALMTASGGGGITAVGTGAGSYGTLTNVAPTATIGSQTNFASAATIASTAGTYSNGQFWFARNLHGQFRTSLVDTANMRVFVGFSAASANTMVGSDLPSTADYEGFSYSTTSGSANWRCIGNAYGTGVAVDSGVAATTAPVDMEIARNDTNNTTVYKINGTTVCGGLTARGSSGYPVYMFAVAGTLETVAKNFRVSFAYAEQDR